MDFGEIPPSMVRWKLCRISPTETSGCPVIAGHYPFHRVFQPFAIRLNATVSLSVAFPLISTPSVR